MARKFRCPDCGQVTTYRPDKCVQVVRLQPGGRLVGSRYLLVRCGGCGKEHEVPEEKTRKAGSHEGPAIFR